VGHTDSVDHLEFSSNGSFLISASTDKTARIWDMKTRKSTIVLGAGRTKYISRVISACFIPQSQMVVTASLAGKIIVWDPSNEHAPQIQEQMDDIQSMTVSSDGRFLATGDRTGSIRTWNLKQVTEGSGIQLITHWTAHTGRVNGLAFTASGQFLVSGGTDGKVAQNLNVTHFENGPNRDADEWDFRGYRDKEQQIFSIVLNPVHNIFASSHQDNLRIWDLERSWEPEEKREAQILPSKLREWYAVAFSSDGNIVAGGTSDGRIQLWNIFKSQLIETLETGLDQGIDNLQFAPNSKMLLVIPKTENEDNYLRVYDLESKGVLFSLPKRPCHAAAFSPTSNYLAFDNVDEIILWDLSSDTKLKNLGRHDTTVTSISFSPDGKYLASSSHDRSIKIFSIENQEVIHDIYNHQDDVNSVVFTPDSQEVISASDDGTLKIFDVDSGQFLFDLARNENAQYLSAQFGCLNRKILILYSVKGRYAQIRDLDAAN
jgi:WD40 repeat protein